MPWAFLSYLIRLPVNILWQKYKRDQTLLQTNLYFFVPGVCINSSYYLWGKLCHIASLIAETKTTSHEVGQGSLFQGMKQLLDSFPQDFLFLVLFFFSKLETANNHLQNFH